MITWGTDNNPQYDVIVIGAGIAGVCTALNLSVFDRKVLLLDGSGIAKGASFGNAGLIERSSVAPFAFPRFFPDLFRMLRRKSVHILPGFLFHLNSYRWLILNKLNSRKSSTLKAMHSLAPLLERCIDEHERLLNLCSSEGLIRPDGWNDIYLSPAQFNGAVKDAEFVSDAFGIQSVALTGPEFRSKEASFKGDLAGAISWKDAASCPDPGRLAQTYFKGAQRRGLDFEHTNVSSISKVADHWSITTDGAKTYVAKQLLITAGAQSAKVLRPLGIRIPLLAKRGYHRMFKPPKDISLNLPFIDVEQGYVLSPMEGGLRLTSGVEFAGQNSPPRQSQIDQAEAAARKLFDLGTPIHRTPWMGSRPCLPDFLPVLGPIKGLDGLWANFGHGHLGMTLSAITGRWVAEAMTGRTNQHLLEPFSATRSWRL